MMRLFCVGLLLTLGSTTSSIAMDDPPATVTLDGTWQVTASLFDGTALDAEKVKERQMVFEKNQLIPVVGGTRKTAIPISVDASKTPMQIDIRNPGKSEKTRGIFELKGKTLKICYAEPGKDRPTDWESKPGSRVFLLTMSRIDNP